MPQHVDLTANVQRTAEEMVRITYSLDEINAVVDGYPALHQRLYVPLGVEIPQRRGVLLDREVTIYELPAGYDATGSSFRRETLAAMNDEDLLFGAPDPDLPTGGNWQLPEDHPTVRRALRDRCRDFTQHSQPLVPGWRQLLALRSPAGKELGMPTGIGWYTHYWLSKMCDGVTMRLSEQQDDIEVLLYKRPADNQSEAVWATPGGYVIKSDTTCAGVTPLQAASARRTADRTGQDVMAYGGVPLRVKYPISSGNTLVAGLETTPFARFVPSPDYAAEQALVTTGRLQRMAGYVGLRALCESNPTGGVSGVNHQRHDFPVWTTHFEYITAGATALADPENQYRFAMDARQFARVAEVVDDLQATYPQLALT